MYCQYRCKTTVGNGYFIQSNRQAIPTTLAIFNRLHQKGGGSHCGSTMFFKMFVTSITTFDWVNRFRLFFFYFFL